MAIIPTHVSVLCKSNDCYDLTRFATAFKPPAGAGADFHLLRSDAPVWRIKCVAVVFRGHLRQFARGWRAAAIPRGDTKEDEQDVR